MICQIFFLRILLVIAKKIKSVHWEEASWTFTKPSYLCTLRSVPLIWLLQLSGGFLQCEGNSPLCLCRYTNSVHAKNSDFTLFPTPSAALRMRMRTYGQLSPVFSLLSMHLKWVVQTIKIFLSVSVFSQCALLNEKLDSLVKALSEEAEAQVIMLRLTE